MQYKKNKNNEKDKEICQWVHETN